MALYTLRVRFALPGGPHRGAGYAEQTYHGLFEADADAIDWERAMREKMDNEPWGRRWLVQRGGLLAHEVSLFRRDIAARRTWEHLETNRFALADWQTTEFGLEVPELPDLGVHAREMPLYDDQTGAVLVICYGADPHHARRVYVGPLSSIVGALSISLLAFDLPGVNLTNNPFTLSTADSYPADPPDQVTYWRPALAESTRDWVGLVRDTAADFGGTFVIPSWQHGTINTVTAIRASNVRARVSRRGLRGTMTDPI